MSGGQGGTSRTGRFVALNAEAVPVKVHATSAGVFIINPTEGVNNGALTSVTGGGPIKVEQYGNLNSAGGFASRIPIASLQIPLTLPGALASATTLPPPDFSLNTASLTTSFYSVNQSAHNVDWTGGFSVAPPDGTYFIILNYSTGNGAGFNLVDRGMGGVFGTQFPYQYIGFTGSIQGIVRGGVPYVLGVATSYAGGSLVNGSRVCTVANGATTMVYQQAQVAQSGGSAFVSCADISAFDNSLSPPRMVAFWGNARFGFDELGNMIVGTSTGIHTGIPAVSDSYIRGGGSPQAALTCDQQVGGAFDRFLVTNNYGSTLTVVVNNWRTSFPPF